MKYTFSHNQDTIRCSDGAQFLTMRRPEQFQNLQTVLHQGNALFDGYTVCFRGEGLGVLSEEAFAVSLRILPLTFSAHTDGLFSCYDETGHAGMEILLRKGGVVDIRLGTGRETLELLSRNSHVLPGVWNVITVVWRGYAGWCDLYINGELSGRKQFRRHTRLENPGGYWYLGKRVDGVRFREDTPFGHFYGFMSWVEICEGAPSHEEVCALHRQWFSGEYEEKLVALGMPDRKCYRDDPHRPQYHLCPPGKWMNEPHGPMFYRGRYHIFYQGNPHAPIWDHLAWGHLISRDMIRWEDAPLALTPEGSEASRDGCWSGSSLVDREGRPRIYYTAGNDSIFPNQSVALATPAQETDEKLLRWHQHPQALLRQDIGWMGEFRDPFVWLEDDTYFMLVGTGDADNGGGNAALYSSCDGLEWTGHGMLLDYDFHQNKELGHVWELPVMLPQKDGDGKNVCHVLLLCACQIEGDIVETYYCLGNWDAEHRKVRKLHDKARLVDLGKGVFTGPSGFVTPDGRSVLFTIAQGRRNLQAEQEAGWAHNGGMPVELRWDGTDLGVRPIREAESLKRTVLLESDGTGDVSEQLAAHPGNRLALELTAVGDTASVCLCAGEERLEVRYDRNAKHLGVWNAAGQEIGRWRGAVDDVDIGDEPIHFTCYLDHSMLEVYLNGKKSVSLRNYFTESRHFQVSGEIRSLTLWEMAAAYNLD